MDWDNILGLLGAAGGIFAGAQDGQDQTVTQKPYLYPGQEEGLGNVIDLARQEYEAGPQQFYPGSPIAGLDQNVIDGQNSQLGSIPIQQQLADIAGQTSGFLSQGGAGRIEGFNLPNQIGGANAAQSVDRENMLQRVTRDNLPGQVGQMSGVDRINSAASPLQSVGGLSTPERVGPSQTPNRVASSGPLPAQIGFGIDQGLQDATLNPIFRELNERILPATNLAATSQGAFGGTRHQLMRNEAAEDATEKAMESLSRANLQARGQSIQQRAGDINAITSRRGQDVQQRSQDIGQSVANMQSMANQRNADLSSNIAARGQDIQQRGQDYSDRSNVRQADVAQRGQDINSQLSARGQDVRQRQGDINAMLGQRSQDVQQRSGDQSFLANQRGQDISQNQMDNSYNLGLLNNYSGQRDTDIRAMLSGRGQDINQNQIQNSAMVSGLNSIPGAMGAQTVPGTIQQQIGQQRTAYDQAQIDADMNRFNFNQQAPIDALTRLQQRMTLSGSPSGMTQTTGGQEGNWLSMLGGGIGGYQLGNMLGGGWGNQQQGQPTGSLYNPEDFTNSLVNGY